MAITISQPSYTRPLRKKPFIRPWAPGEQLVLREAVQLVGKKHYQNEWTGVEPDARGLMGPPTPPPGPDGALSQCVRYVVDGKQVTMPHEKALKLFAAEEDDLRQLWEEESIAAVRYFKAWGAFRRIMYSETVSATILTEEGLSFPIPKETWASKNADKILKTGTAEVFSGGDFGSTYEGLVLIPEDDLMRHLEGRNKQNEPIAQKNKGGRPTKWNWEGMLIEACRIAHNEGLPETQAQLAGKLQDWFAMETGDSPDIRDIQKRVSAVFRAIREGEN